MKISRILNVIPFLFLFANSALAQMSKPKYVWESQDTLKIAYKTILTNDSYQPQKLKWNQKRVIGTALMVTCSALAYYYHQKAESSYERYLDTGSIAEMNTLFRETEKYDQLKGFAGIGIEIGFLLNVWSFF